MARTLLSYDPEAVYAAKSGLDKSDFEAIKQNLEDIRDEVATKDVELFDGNHDDIPDEKQPLDSAFYLMPEKLLAEYRDVRSESELGRILELAKGLRDEVDRVVVLGIGGSYMGAKALMDACCDPYFNELSRGERGSRPRMYFEGNNVDNDATQGLLKLLGTGKATSVDDSFAIVVISKSGGTLETAVAFRQMLDRLKESVGGDAEKLARRIVPVTGGDESKLRALATSLGCKEMFTVPDGVGGRFSILSAVGLMPAAMLGLDVVKLLDGAATMNEHFRTAPAGENAVLDYAGVCHLAEKKRGMNLRILSVWAKSLECTGLWYDQLLAESLGKKEIGATPITTVNTRDLHSRAQQHQEGSRDKLITNVIVDNWKADSLAVGSMEHDDDGLNSIANKTLPELMTAAIQGTNAAYAEGGRPTADIHLPQVDEFALGQFFQMMMLATVVEGRMIDINPYGQPGVEYYKKHMKNILYG
jgi:glucose-6-phosphate isomerase